MTTGRINQVSRPLVLPGEASTPTLGEEPASAHESETGDTTCVTGTVLRCAAAAAAAAAAALGPPVNQRLRPSE